MRGGFRINSGRKTKKIEYYTDKKGCHICTSHCTVRGYPQICVNGKRMYLHRFIYEQSFGKIPKGLEVMHKCDNPTCINIEHLTLGTHQDNMDDKVIKNRQAKGDSLTKNRNHFKPKGIKNPACKLKEDDVLNIRIDTSSQIEIAKKYNISQSQVSAIKTNKSWKN